jgi:hypothetical protein
MVGPVETWTGSAAGKVQTNERGYSTDKMVLWNKTTGKRMIRLKLVNHKKSLA